MTEQEGGRAFRESTKAECFAPSPGSRQNAAHPKSSNFSSLHPQSLHTDQSNFSFLVVKNRR